MSEIPAPVLQAIVCAANIMAILIVVMAIDLVKLLQPQKSHRPVSDVRWKIGGMALAVSSSIVLWYWSSYFITYGLVERLFPR